LVTGAFLLPLSRLADIYGGYVVFTCGMIWFTIWTLIAGFSQNYLMLIACRALQGFGPAAFLPSGIMLLGRIYRPGPRKNMVFFLYGAFSPIGFFSGIFVGGISGQWLSWNWYFWIGAILLSIASAIALVTVPSDRLNGTRKITMDWCGVLTIVPGLLLTVFAIMNSSHATGGWRTPSVYITFSLGGMFLCAAFYVEGWIAAQPLLPFDMLRVSGMKALVISLFFTYGVFGIYLFYASF
jgi:MFS family permease